MAFTKEMLDKTPKSLFPMVTNPYWAPEIHEIAEQIEKEEEKEEEEPQEKEPQEKEKEPQEKEPQEKEPQEKEPQEKEEEKEKEEERSIEEMTKTYKSWDIFAVNQIILEIINNTDTAEIPFMQTYRELCAEYPPKETLKKSIEEMFQSIPRSEYEWFMIQIQKPLEEVAAVAAVATATAEVDATSVEDPNEESIESYLNPDKKSLEQEINEGINPDINDNSL
jgi:hypothetical protein